MAAGTGENHTLLLYEIEHTLFVFFSIFLPSLVVKNHSFTSFNLLLRIWKVFLYFYENKKDSYRRQTLLGLNILSLYENP